jgi:5-(carboxyamino)imidazole ribonucleotide synthase
VTAFKRSLKKPFQSGFTLGFIGGGQLARMSAVQAFRFGFDIAVYATSASKEPVEMMTPLVSRGTRNNLDALTEFAKKCDLITLENEFVDADVLLEVQRRSGTPIYPSPGSFKRIGDKLSEKRTFTNAGIPVAPFSHIARPADLEKFGEKYGWPYVLKSSKGGYDGYGNATVNEIDNAVKAWSKLGGSDGREVIAEAFVPFTMELAVMVARNHTGTVVYPCVESIQQGHICKEIIVPARIPAALQVQAQELALAAVECIDGTGVFGFEFFLTHDNQILLNESAPRPHNSGHYTIEGCITSQFENHVRAVCGLPLGPADLLRPAAVMINLLGTQNGPSDATPVDEVLSLADAHLHIYGKQNSRIGRKMGHLTLLGDTHDEILEKARKLASQIHI